MHINRERVLLFNPPGGLWSRGEPRCEGNLDEMAYFPTAPNNLAIIAAFLRQAGYECIIRDYPVETKGWAGYKQDLQRIRPGILFLNATSLTVRQDMRAFAIAREILGRFSFNVLLLPYLSLVDLDGIKQEYLRGMDIAIISESEAVLPGLIRFFRKEISLDEVRGILWFKEGLLQRNPPVPLLDNLDDIPFPERSLMRNQLYCRPDNGRPMASIMSARGCSSSCIFCSSSLFAQGRVRYRCIENIIAEMRQCVEDYGIRDFLFRADTFTLNREWLLEFCNRLAQELPGINWAANSRTDCFDEQIAEAMRRAGCYLVEFGIEAADDDSLRRMRKGVGIEAARRSLRIAQRFGIMSYGTFLIGFPWDNHASLQRIEQFILREPLDFMEVFIVQPVPGTELSQMLKCDGLLEHPPSDSHQDLSPSRIKGTLYLSYKELEAFRRRIHRIFYFRPRFIFKRILSLKSHTELFSQAKQAVRLFKTFIA